MKSVLLSMYLLLSAPAFAAEIQGGQVIPNRILDDGIYTSNDTQFHDARIQTLYHRETGELKHLVIEFVFQNDRCRSASLSPLLLDCGEMKDGIVECNERDGDFSIRILDRVRDSFMFSAYGAGRQFTKVHQHCEVVY